MSSDAPERAATVRSVFAVGEFRVLWLAHAQSRVGDQLARVALAVLVFDQTGSALLTGLTYALTFLPPLVSAPLLTGLADRYPRRAVLVMTDVFRCGVFALMAIPSASIPMIAVLLLVAVSAQPLNGAARNAILPSILVGDRYVVGFGVTGVTDSVSQLVGFAFGGVLVGLIGAPAVLGLNAVTFALGAALVGFGLRPHRPVGPGLSTVGATPARRSVFAGAAMIWRDPRLRSLAALEWVYGFYIAPEGVAAPYANQLAAGAVTVGLLMAADPVGAGVGAYVFSRWVRPADRSRIITPLAALAGVPLILSALHPSVPLAIALWALSGVLSMYTMLTHTAFVQLVPDHFRGQTVGLLSAGLQATQGLGVAVAGAVAEVVAPSVTVAACGAAGVACALWAGSAWNRVRSEVKPVAT